MADAKQGWTAAGGWILAAATGLPTSAHAAPPRAIVELAPEHRPAAAAPSPSKFAARMTQRREPVLVESQPAESLRIESTPVQPPPIDPECRTAESPCQRNRPVAQWWQRCKAHCRDKFWGYPEEFVPAPLGAAVADNVSRQAARGQAARMVLYQYDFLPMSDQLKPRGRLALARVGEWASHGAGPVLIEPTPGRPDLDEARRRVVWREMQHGPFAIPPEMIVMGCSEIVGLRGGEALLVDKNLLMQTSARGTAMGGGGGR